MLVYIVHLTLKSGSEEQAREYVRKMQEHTRREPGCRLYIGHQSIDNPRNICFYEQYDDRAALAAHHAAPYFKQYVTEGLAKLVESRTQEFFAPVD